MNILIYTKNNNIREIFDDVTNIMPFDQYKRSSESAYILGTQNDEIRIVKYQESNLRGHKSRIILYDGDFTEEEKSNMSYGLIDNRYEVFKGECKPETLLAPIGMLKWLLFDYTCIVTKGKFEDEVIKLVTTDIVKAINYVSEIQGNIYCYQANVCDTYDLWCYEVYDGDEYSTKEKMIEGISKTEIK